MKSSSGLYISRLDHIRGFAAFMVFFWHFTHVYIPHDYVPSVPLMSLLEEGHMGVGLFMTLSGYLFAKVIDGRSLDLRRFYLNRLLRLMPLFLLVLAYWCWRGRVAPADIIPGLITGSLPGGTWSIVVELHFYVLFPLLLMLQRRGPIVYPLAMLAAAISLRAAIWSETGNVQDAAYWTIIGCIDFFVVGMMANELAKLDAVKQRAWLLLAAGLAGATALAHGLNLAGGFFGTATHPGWFVLPTLQALAFAAVIVGYEAARIPMPRLVDRVLAKVGEVSYSIYLLHFIVFTVLAKKLNGLGFDMSDFTTAALMSVAVFPAIVIVSMVSYELVEKPFLRLRKAYQRPLPRSAEPTTRAATF